MPKKSYWERNGREGHKGTSPHKRGSDNFNKPGSAFLLKCGHLSKIIGRYATRPESGHSFQEKKPTFLCCVFSEFGRFKISLDLVCSGVNFLTGEDEEMKSGYLPGLFELTWLVFGETLIYNKWNTTSISIKARDSQFSIFLVT